MSKTREGGREGGRKERADVASSPGAASKPPRLNIPSASIKRTVIKWVCGGKKMKAANHASDPSAVFFVMRKPLK